ncbi:hypothetical protein HPB48_018580 [Haemaphysalis longicornis]|uniref:Amino acid permease N-terminal domain-containing protein n=1 Tax=Haemaphysalis longicornis TaxID=44386 RepID=A0A9J6G7G5_HAELO|nr:hypothetical protein HPB48_018580 [Haemaphysalis longicornis]
MGGPQCLVNSPPTSPTELANYGTVYDTVNVKSLLHYTHEALPRVDHYRNVMSVHGHISRPTLDELHYSGRGSIAGLTHVSAGPSFQWSMQRHERLFKPNARNRFGDSVLGSPLKWPAIATDSYVGNKICP